MKRLDQLVHDELLARRIIPRTPAGDPITHSVQLSPEQLAELVKHTADKQTYARVRLQQDPALTILVQQSLLMLNLVSSLPAPQFAKDQSLTQLLVEMIEVWESSHEKYNAQLRARS